MASDNSENYDWLFEEVDKKGRNKDESSNDMASSSKGIRICENNLRSDEKGSEGLSEQSGGMGGAKDGGAIVVAVSNKPKSESVKPHTTAAIDVINDDDDDCIILDCDPNKSIEVVNETEDDVIIVGQKGEIACRDFPHPRHLCVKFPFTSTPHELHCVQCFCFICDIRAPCSRWVTGKSSSHHCHSTDDDEHWRVERLRAKGNGYKAPPVVSLPTMPALETRKNNYGNDNARLINALLCTPEVPMLKSGPDHDHHEAHPPPGFSIPRPSFPSNHYIASARGAARSSARSLSSISNPIRPSFKRAGLAGALPRNINSHTINNIMNNNNNNNNYNNNNNNYNNRLVSVTQLPTSPSLNWRRSLQTTSLGIPNPQGSNRLDLSSHPSSGLGYPNHLSPRAQIRASAFSVWRAPFPPLDPLPGVGNLENLTLPRPGAAIFRPTSNYAAALAGPSEPSSALGANGNGLSSRLGVSPGLGSLETQARGGLLMDGVDGLGQASHGGNSLVVSSSEFCSAWVSSFLGRGGFESLSSSSPFRRTDSTFPSTNINGKEFQGQR